MATRRPSAGRSSRTWRPAPFELAGQLIQSSVDGIAALDLEGRCTFWNPALERLTGYASHEVVGKSLPDLLPCMDRDRHLRHLRRRSPARRAW